MNRLLRLCGLIVLLVSVCGTASSQISAPTISRIDIKHVGPPAASDEIIRGNIRIKPGDKYLPSALDEDIHNLYSTGLFSNLRIAREQAPDGSLILTYFVQGKSRVTDIQITGNKRLSKSKIKKKITSKIGDPLDARKMFTDSQAIQELYQKSGYPGTTVRTVEHIIEETGRASVVFEITESQKVKITRVDFAGAQAFTEKELRKKIKTRKRWMFSWLTGSGVFKDEQFEDDKERLKEFYRDHGYIDFEIKDVQFESPTPTTMIVRFEIYEGRQYRVGQITFNGTTMLPTNAISPGFKPGRVSKMSPDRAQWLEAATLNRNFKMKEGDVFKIKDLAADIEAIEDFYGAKGHIDVTTSTGNLGIKRIPNTETGTMDLEFQVNEGQMSYIEKVDIRGNTKTKDKVIRRELSVSPGEPFNMVAVKLSRRRLENLQYFEDPIEARPESTEVLNRRDLIIGVQEKKTGQMRVGAGFSTVDSIVGFAEITQGNFDLFNPPNFTGGGQKFRLFLQLGTERKDFDVNFSEPWFLDRKLAFDVSLFHREASYLSINDLYEESRTGASLALTRALWSDFFIGSVFYKVEDVGIDLASGIHGPILVSGGGPPGPGGGSSFLVPANAPNAILSEEGHTLLTRLGFSLARDTRNSTKLPDAGQRTELSAEWISSYLGGERDFYKLGASTAWYFRGFAKGHVLELAARTGVAEGLRGDSVPFYERYYLGGAYSLRGYEFRSVSPREPGFDEPVGGNTFWFGTIEYSIPIFQREKTGVRIAFFYDIGNVTEKSYDYNFKDYTDNWGVGLRLELPIGPLRLDYGVPIQHDDFQKDSGRFQFTAGWTRPL